ncbi:MAG: carboxy-S-adenosyl-L-methionine synthase CmoA [Phycisphaerae bacterium]
MKDSIYSEYRERAADFVFDANVVSVFDDMIRRSVPGYATVIAMTKVFAEQAARDNTCLYDLGCSLGASTLAMRRGVEGKNGCRIIAVDNSKAMIERCDEIIRSDVSRVPVELRLADVRDVEIENASLCAMNYTLQFLSPDSRCELMAKIAGGTNRGGMLILSEKVRFESEEEDEFQREMHLNFKRLNGYSELEISQKRKSLENVLLMDTIDEHFVRLKSAGFSRAWVWQRCFNFVSIAAVK